MVGLYIFARKNVMRNFRVIKAIPVVILAVFLMTGFSGCKKVKDTIEAAWEGYWAGVFDLGDGWQIELSGDRATYVTAGISKTGTNVGDSFAIGMELVGNNKWKGNIRDKNGFGFLVRGTAEIVNNKLVITPDGAAPYTLNKGVKNTGSSGGGTGTNAQTLLNEKVDGKRGDQKIYKVTIPTGVKVLEVRTTEVAGTYYYNLADLFVSKGVDPTVKLLPTYSWTADKASVNPNREDDVVVFQNPAAGVYHIMLYGYNSDFTSQLVVKIEK